MGNILRNTLTVGELESGRWIALTTAAPYLCFEAESRDALKAKLGRAADFCRESADHLEVQGHIENIIPFHVKETLLVKDFV
jgi:hypothetical protein